MALRKPKNLVGLDIGSHSIKIVELKHLKHGFELKNFGVAQLPPEAIVDGVIMDSAVVVESIRNLASNLKLKNRNVATSVSGLSLIVKKIQLPLMSESELEEQIQLSFAKDHPCMSSIGSEFREVSPSHKKKDSQEALGRLFATKPMDSSPDSPVGQCLPANRHCRKCIPPCRVPLRSARDQVD